MLQSVWILTSPSGINAHESGVVGLFPSHGKATEYRDNATPPVTDGEILEWGLEGVHVENHIDYALARLENFQAGQLKCRENALAITHLQEARHWLEHRMHDRDNRGVLGTTEL